VHGPLPNPAAAALAHVGEDREQLIKRWLLGVLEDRPLEEIARLPLEALVRDAGDLLERPVLQHAQQPPLD